MASNRCTAGQVVGVRADSEVQVQGPWGICRVSGRLGSVTILLKELLTAETSHTGSCLALERPVTAFKVDHILLGS